MQKVDKEGNVTKEYIDFVEKLNRDDLERFYMGADFLNDDLNQEIKRLNNIIDQLIDTIAISLNDDAVEKAFNMNLDDFKIWIKEKLKK